MQGILIEYLFTPEWVGGQMLQANMRVGTREEYEGLRKRELHNFSWSFVTNQEIRQVIQARKLPTNYPIGELSGIYDKNAKQLLWSTYEPKKTSAFERVQGIAQLLEAKFLIKAKEVFPNVQRIFHASPSVERKAQMKKRGFFPNDREEIEQSFEEELSALLFKIAADTVKHRKGESHAGEKGWIGFVKRKWRLPQKYRSH